MNTMREGDSHERTISMKAIVGRVLARETNAGIANLVVAAFDQERGAPETFVDERQPELSVDRLGHRIGSVLTNDNGDFTIETEHCEPAGGSSRPHLVLAVFAPEDALDIDEPAPLPPERRLLHVSRIPRFHAGAIEAYVIRLLQSQLDAFGIPSGVAARDRTRSEAETAHLLSSIARTLESKERVAEYLQPKLARQAETAVAVRQSAKKIVAELSAVPQALRAHPLFVKEGAASDAAHAHAIATGLNRLAAYPSSLTLQFDPGELEALGLRQTANGVEGEVDARKLMDHVAARFSGTHLIRRRSLLDAVPLQKDGGDADQPIQENPPHMADEPHPAAGGQLEQQILARVLGQLDDLPAAGENLPSRPSAADVQKTIDALELRGGVADATAFHDFHVLQVAFKHVWTQAFDASLRDKAEELYHEYTQAYEAAGLKVPPLDAISDVAQLKEFHRGLGGGGSVRAPEARSGPGGGFVPAPDVRRPGGITPPANPIPDEVRAAIAYAAPDIYIDNVWEKLSPEQQLAIMQQARIFAGPAPQDEKDRAIKVIAILVAQPSGPGARLEKLVLELGNALAEPYAFDVFARDTYNFGIMLTYRQQWEPLAYQAGELVATIPLAPGESRKYTRRQMIKKTRAEKEIEKAMSSRSFSMSEIGRAESEIMNRSSTATNFKMSASGSFNIGIGSLSGSSEFNLDQKEESSDNKKNFHEATLKAAEDYRQERSLEIDTTSAAETEEVSSGEISNPNNEITVTYLFYELERRYRVSEQIHRARPVIMVAQDVPAPHEIDEAWLVQYQWILARVLLDDSFRGALDYLVSGLAGDQVAIDVIRDRWNAQKRILEKLEAQVHAQLAMRDALRETLIKTAQEKKLAEAFSMPTTMKVLSLGLAPDVGEATAQMLEANRQAAETRLQYAEQALADMQKKLGDASAAFEQATRDYTAALQNQFSRRVAIDQLRIHVKQNILYYMQAIWDHEPPDQRFFRLYNKKVKCPEPGIGTVAKTHPATKLPPQPAGSAKMWANFSIQWGPVIQETPEVELIEIADIDNPLGYKGNYIVFPLKKPCFLTSFMLNEFINDYFGVGDPDETGNFTIEALEEYVRRLQQRDDVPETEKARWRQLFLDRLGNDRPSSDEIIVSTGQLFVEALPGSHPLLEDFKLRHRREDVRKARAEVRHAELENLRLAARLDAKEHDDPDIEKRIVVDKGATIVPGDT
jgi:hypothetical protein